MTKFKGRSSMRQYLKMKPVKWNFKWWFRCANSNGYLYEFDLYLGKKQNVQVSLGEGVGMQLPEKLKGTFCTLLFDNSFNSPLLINKLTKTSVSCPNIIKMYNAGMVGVDVINQKTAAYRLNCKSKFRFYLILSKLPL